MPGKWFTYKYLRNMASNFIPHNQYYFFETLDAYLIFLKEDSNILYQSDDLGQTIDLIHNCQDSSYGHGGTGNGYDYYNVDTLVYISSADTWFFGCTKPFTLVSPTSQYLQITRVIADTQSKTASSYQTSLQDVAAHDLHYVSPVAYCLVSGVNATDIYLSVESYNFTTSSWGTPNNVSLENPSANAGRRFVSNWCWVSTDAYCLVSVSNWEHVELWKYPKDGTIAKVREFDTGTELPPRNQMAIAYDGSDILSFILYNGGTRETFTVVAVAPGSITDGTYFIFEAIDMETRGKDQGVRTNKLFYAWFDKVGDESGDPAPSGYTKVTIDISGASTAQDVSDAIELAMQTVGLPGYPVSLPSQCYSLVLADNSSSTTTTCELIVSGIVTNAADVDCGLTITVTQQGSDPICSYYTYSISGDSYSYSSTGQYNVALMREIHSQSFEKGVNLLEPSVHQIGRNRKYTKIAYLTEDSTEITTSIGDLRAVSDNYLMDDNGAIYNYQDCMGDLFGANVEQICYDNDVSQISTSLIFTKGQSIILYDPDDEVLFHGLIEEKEDIGRGIYEYYCTSLNREAWVRDFTDDLSDVTTKNAKNIIEYLIDTYGVNVYYDNSIDSAFTTVYTGLDFKSQNLASVLSVLMDYEDGLWWIDGDGKVHAYKIANIPQLNLLYPACYTFENDTPGGGCPSGWSCYTSGSGTVDVVASFEGHLQVVKQNNPDYTLSTADITKTFTSQNYGSVSCWIYDTVANHPRLYRNTRLQFWCSAGSTLAFNIGIVDTNLCVLAVGYPYSGTDIVICSVLPNTWYYIQVDFKHSGTYKGLADDTFQVYVNLQGPYGPYSYTHNNCAITAFEVGMGMNSSGHTGHTVYTDSVSFSWDGIMKNMNDGYYSMSQCTKRYFDYGVASKPKVKEMTTKINLVQLYGAIVNGKRLQTSEDHGQDGGSQDSDGIYEYNDHFPHINDQDELDDLSDAILNRTGIATNPIHIYGFDISNKYITKGSKLRCSLPGYYDITEPSENYILGSILDLKRDISSLNLSSGLTHERRKDEVQTTKTSTADEEQINILANTKVETLIKTTNPSASDDEYPVGTQWFNSTNSRLYVCVDNTPSTAVWKYITLT